MFIYTYIYICKYWSIQSIHVHPRYTDSAGIARVQGGASLKSSQHYPVLFGQVVGERWLNNKAGCDVIKRKQILGLCFGRTS